MPAKPIPVPNELTEPFWQAVNNRQLVIQRCQQCQRYAHPPVGVCINCLSSDLAYEPVSGKGTVHSFTITYDARQPAFEAIQPYAVAVIQLAEQDDLFMLSNLPGTSLDDVKVGLPVEVDFEALDESHLIPQFKAASRPD